MVTQVHSDKSINPILDKTTQSNPSTNTRQENGKALSTEPETRQSRELMPDVDTARQLYELENNRPETLKSTLETPEQARSLLDKIVQQMMNMPEKALQSQINGTAGHISNLLSTAPA